ncbi:hypothetical protein BS50DRAFT_65017 [Corynespora cassiicola Philippines]|uniref:AAA+ ATPase domain-containing protein n=1 Tax=Corynespora cassiicola Philippines TaxID=1448308 RepID=A0A2T2MZK7_CORCC|nr:hypothetical protein BS50DRAFT_65017 [Corynespora cassiicola Philippines]
MCMPPSHLIGFLVADSMSSSRRRMTMPGLSSRHLAPDRRHVKPYLSLLSQQLNHVMPAEDFDRLQTAAGDTQSSEDGIIVEKSPEALVDLREDLMDSLMPASMCEHPADCGDGDMDDEIQHAPLVDRRMLTRETSLLLPQYALFGFRDWSKLFLNTNAPFSTFICGVQGSGKSHTTSCIMENSLVRSPHLGYLQSPLSALVFSYGQLSGDGMEPNASEAAFLAATSSTLPGHPHVEKITVLVSPSNLGRMENLYHRLPNVSVVPFKLKPANLDVDAMLTLMAVSGPGDGPLYMAQVTDVLRQIAAQGGPFNYTTFKRRLNGCKFNAKQSTMLQLRLGLLESFLDLNNQCPAPDFRPGEVTIMDMSCPFVDSNTACILFRLALRLYLRSDVPGKLVVLDEAHKYMVNVPGARSLKEALCQTIRFQRHYGVRVVISTQEPTFLTDLIALCSVVVIHRFSSPEWFAALKRHIHVAHHDHGRLMQAIESLKTGAALVYCPTAALGKDRDGKLVKGTGRLMEIRVRQRVTRDGGRSVLAA